MTTRSSRSPSGGAPALAAAALAAVSPTCVFRLTPTREGAIEISHTIGAPSGGVGGRASSVVGALNPADPRALRAALFAFFIELLGRS
ncbi:MAG TPA: hypothetical protein VGD56_03930 [Gemmatirosa sp.]